MCDRGQYEFWRGYHAGSVAEFESANARKGRRLTGPVAVGMLVLVALRLGRRVV